MASAPGVPPGRANDRAHLELRKLLTEKETLAKLREEIAEQIRRLKHEQQYAVEVLSRLERGDLKPIKQNSEEPDLSMEDEPDI